MSGAYVFHSTFLKMIADAAKDDNPLADLDPALLTKESREKAIIKVENGISSGLITLPEPLTAFFKSLGSTDMHFENIICDGCFPAVIDLETILSPVSEKYVQNKYDPGLYLARRNSVFFTTLLPKAGPDDDHEYSSLLNCSEAGCLPEINGKYVNVIPYTDQFIDGYRQAYDRIMQNREAIFEKLSGAPGIGIMAQRMKEGGYEHEDLSFLEDHVNLAVSAVQLRERDHLCCGNNALAEYYISAGKADDAGKLLFAMKERKEACGRYRYMNHEYTNSVTASLFYGAAGIGYEMLRYAFPETVLSLF